MDRTIPTMGRLGLCRECGDHAAKYRCPRCEVASCSLECSVRHKERLDCSGLRDRSKYVPMDKFTLSDLMSDYGLLEAAARCVDSYSRDTLKGIGSSPAAATTSGNQAAPFPWLPRHLAKLRAVCSKRGNCRLAFLPAHFKRRQENTSRYCWALGAIEWRVQLKFPNVFEGDDTFTVSRVKDTDTIYQLLKPFLSPSEDGSNTSGIAAKTSLDPYISAGFAGTAVLLKNENPRFSRKRFFEMDIELTLMENLAGKALVEHPVIFVVLSSHSDYFLVDHDDLDQVRPDVSREGHLSSCSGAASDRGAQARVQAAQEDRQQGQEEANNQSDLEKRVMDGCFEYYLNYYREKYGVVSSPDPLSTTGCSRLSSTSPAVPAGRDVSGLVQSRSKGVSSALVDYSGSEVDDDDDV